MHTSFQKVFSFSFFNGSFSDKEYYHSFSGILSSKFWKLLYVCCVFSLYILFPTTLFVEYVSLSHPH
jgi:hypothetical protein